MDNSTNQDFYVPSGFDPDRYKFPPLPSPSNITLLCAPLCAAYLIRIGEQQEWIPELVHTYVPEMLLPIVTSPGFVRTLLIILFLQTGGKFITEAVNFLLDLALPKEDEDVVP